MLRVQQPSLPHSRPPTVISSIPTAAAHSPPQPALKPLSVPSRGRHSRLETMPDSHTRCWGRVGLRTWKSLTTYLCFEAVILQRIKEGPNIVNLGHSRYPYKAVQGLEY